jgi:hypothetical protein
VQHMHGIPRMPLSLAPQHKAARQSQAPACLLQLPNHLPEILNMSTCSITLIAVPHAIVPISPSHPQVQSPWHVPCFPSTRHVKPCKSASDPMQATVQLQATPTPTGEPAAPARGEPAAPARSPLRSCCTVDSCPGAMEMMSVTSPSWLQDRQHATHVFNTAPHKRQSSLISSRSTFSSTLLSSPFSIPNAV